MASQIVHEQGDRPVTVAFSYLLQILQEFLCIDGLLVNGPLLYAALLRDAHEQGLRLIIWQLLIHLSVLAIPGPLCALHSSPHKHGLIYPNKRKAVCLGLVQLRLQIPFHLWQLRLQVRP